MNLIPTFLFNAFVSQTLWIVYPLDPLVKVTAQNLKEVDLRSGVTLLYHKHLPYIKTTSPVRKYANKYKLTYAYVSSMIMWNGHVSRSSGIAKVILQETVEGITWGG